MGLREDLVPHGQFERQPQHDPSLLRPVRVDCVAHSKASLATIGPLADTFSIRSVAAMRLDTELAQRREGVIVEAIDQRFARGFDEEDSLAGLQAASLPNRSASSRVARWGPTRVIGPGRIHPAAQCVRRDPELLPDPRTRAPRTALLLTGIQGQT